MQPGVKPPTAVEHLDGEEDGAGGGDGGPQKNVAARLGVGMRGEGGLEGGGGESEQSGECGGGGAVPAEDAGPIHGSPDLGDLA
jgi:hypothetical protein